MVDFREIVNKTKLYNFHTHTQYCDGRAEMEDFVVEAIKQGFDSLGFSPHSPILIESPCNMKFDDVPVYFEEIYRLKTKYGSQINLYASMEIDYFDDWGASNDFFTSLPLDYRIGSVHFIPSFENSDEYIDIDGNFVSFNEKMKLHFKNDIRGVVESFYAQCLKMIEKGGFDIIGHFDKIGYNSSCFKEGIEQEGWYEKLVRTTFDAIMDLRYIIEINTKALETHGRLFPNVRYFEWIKRYKPQVLINSDAHYPHLLNAGRMKAMNLLLNN